MGPAGALAIWFNDFVWFRKRVCSNKHTIIWVQVLPWDAEPILRQAQDDIFSMTKNYMVTSSLSRSEQSRAQPVLSYVERSKGLMMQSNSSRCFDRLSMTSRYIVTLSLSKRLSWQHLQTTWNSDNVGTNNLLCRIALKSSEVQGFTPRSFGGGFGIAKNSS